MTTTEAVRTHQDPEAAKRAAAQKRKEQKFKAVDVGWLVSMQDCYGPAAVGPVVATYPHENGHKYVIFRNMEGGIEGAITHQLDSASPPATTTPHESTVPNILANGTAPDISQLLELVEYITSELRAAAGAGRCRWGGRRVQVDPDTFAAAEGFGDALANALEGLGHHLAKGKQPSPNDPLREKPIARLADGERLIVTPEGRAAMGHPLAGLQCHDCDKSRGDCEVVRVDGDKAIIIQEDGEEVAAPLESIVVWLKDIAAFMAEREQGDAV